MPPKKLGSIHALFLAAWTIGSFLAQENRLLGYAVYIIPFVYSSVSTEGIEIAKNSNLVEISPVSSDAGYWDENKGLCEQVISLHSDNKFIDKISKRYKYSSFLRTEEANILLNEVIHSQKNTTSDPTESLEKSGIVFNLLRIFDSISSLFSDSRYRFNNYCQNDH